ncbi:MAG: hypothetical protein EA384_04825 [Spirochaetaceae bacterium]|nr:MAG: hypothetical protein EA384_04825 [Spirochaetaceae bacterium]
MNNQQIDVTLEQERTLADVVAAINSWVVGNGQAITTLRIDGTECTLDRPQTWGDRPLETIGEVHVETSAQWQLILAHLELVLQFVRSWETALGNGDRPAIDSLVAQQQDLARHLQEHVELIFLELPQTPLHDVFSTTGDPSAMTSPPAGSEVLGRQLNALAALIEQRVNEIRHPGREAAATAGLISALLNDVREVSVLLQTGKDQQAMGNVVRFSELVEKLLRIVPHLAREDEQFRARIERGGDLDTITTALNSTLRELVDALDVRDSVLIGDLLEYEIASRIEELIGVIPTGPGNAAGHGQ